MNSYLPRVFGSISSLFLNPLALLGGVLLCVAPGLASAQSVTFAGQQITLPVSGLNEPIGIAIDSTGNVFVTDVLNNRVVELPKTSTSFGQQTTLPATGLSSPVGVALDSAGDVFIADWGNGRVVELPQTGTGYAPQITLPFSGFGLDTPLGVAADSAGNLFVSDDSNNRVLELPRTGTGYGTQVTLPFGSLNHLYGVAVDTYEDVFVVETVSNTVEELPMTPTGYGPQVTLPFSALDAPAGITVDNADDVFITQVYGPVLELPKTSAGYGTQVTLPFSSLYGPLGVASDDTGDVFAVDSLNNRVVELQKHSFNFGSVYLCAPGQTIPAPCSQTLALNFNITASGTLGTPKVLTGGTPDLDFTLASGSTCTGAVTAGATCTVNVSFVPLATGVRNGSVEITDGGGTALATVPISGIGVAAADAPPVPQVSTTSLQFGLIAFGSGETETLPLMVTNIGGGTLTVAPSIAGKSFLITGSTCGGGVTTGESCTLQVEFSPVTAGQHSEFLTLKTNGSSNPTIVLQGLASAEPIAQVSPTTLNFGAIAFGSTATLPLTVTNIGAGTLTVTPSLNAPSYTIAASTCEGGVTAGNSCTLQVEFSPASVGSHNDIWTLQTNGATNPITRKANPEVTLQGVANGLSVAPSVLQFGSIVYGSTEVLPLTVTNLGLPGTVTIGTVFNGHGYTVLTTAENTCQAGLATGESCTLPVQFSPISVGYHHDVLTLTPSAGAAATTVGLEGTATALGQTVSFTGAPTILPFSGLRYTTGVAVDSAGNLFISEQSPNNVLESSKGATGYGPLVTLPFTGLQGPTGIAVDSTGNVFVADFDGSNIKGTVVELPWTGTGYGAQITLPFSGLGYASGVAVDSAGNVFVAEFPDTGSAPGGVLELPKTLTGYGPQMTVAGDLYNPSGVVLDSAGDLFIPDFDLAHGSYGIVELPKTSTGYGPPITMPLTGSGDLGGIAMDSAQNILLVNYNGELVAEVLELPWTGTGYGPPITLPFNSSTHINGIAVDSTGDVFIGEGGVVELQKNSVNFGNAYVCPSGQMAPVPCSQTLTLNYQINGNATLGTPKVLTGGVPGGDFTLVSGNTCTGAASEGSSCTVTVTFAPLAAGTRNGSVEIVESDGKVLTTTPIYGLGVAAADAPPVAQLSTTALNFGYIAFGTTETLPLTITNIGGQTLTVAASFSGSISYSIAASNCGGGVASGQSCTLEVKFNPASVAPHYGVLTVETNGSTNPTVTLQGVGVAVPAGNPIATVSPTYQAFGTIPIGTTETAPITIANTGGGILTVTPSISGTSYSITGGNCGSGVVRGYACTLVVQFSPKSIASHDDVLTVNTNGGNPTAKLAGKVSGLSVLGGASGAPLQFGSVASGSTEVETLTVTNVGLPGTVMVGTAITVGTTTTPGHSYTILTTSQNTCLAGIAAGQSCTLPVEFAPTSSGVHDDLLTLTPSAGGGDTTVWLLGTTP